MPTLPSHKYSLTYLEHCKVVMADERLTYVRREDAVEKSFALPYANSNALLLGPGTSLTQQAARLLGSEGVLVGFTAGGGTPLYLTSVNEYRPTEYMQGWCSFWFDANSRLLVAKQLQAARVELIKSTYTKAFGASFCGPLIELYLQQVLDATDNNNLLLAEARFTKALYKQLSTHYSVDFAREPRKGDRLNGALDTGNYLAYGLAACALWVLGISFAMGVSHGQTRRGALVFDVADLVKDALVLPTVFESYALKETDSQSRQRVLSALEDSRALTFMLNTLVDIVTRYTTTSVGFRP